MPPGCFPCCTTGPSTSGVSCPRRWPHCPARSRDRHLQAGAVLHGHAGTAGFSVSGERMADKAAAQQLKTACQGAAAMVKKGGAQGQIREVAALYDLTTLQRDANRLLGYTAQQTLDYLQNLYEKKLCTYPRTDSRYLTSDMAASLPELVRLTAGGLPLPVIWRFPAMRPRSSTTKK